MRKRHRYGGTAENGDITFREKENIPDENGVTVLLADLDPQRAYKVMSPRLAHKNQAKDFAHEVIEEAPDATL